MNISVVGDGTEAIRHLDLLEPDVILLDLNLAGPIDGFDTCRAIRSRSAALIVIAAASDGVYDEVVALAVGADNYMVATTPVEVVVARLRSLMRRAQGFILDYRVVGTESGSSSMTRVAATRPSLAMARGSSGVPLRGWVRAETLVQAGGPRGGGANGDGHRTDGFRTNGFRGNGTSVPDGPTERIVDGELVIDLVAREVHVAGAQVELTRIEFDLLVALARHPRRVLTRDQLMASAWDEPFDGSHVLDTHLSRLRGKITAAGGERVAHALRGVGYRLRT